MSTDRERLPELPPPAQPADYILSVSGDLYTADQTRSYALHCVEAERERCAKVVESVPSYVWVDGSDQWGRPCHAKVLATSSDFAAAIRKGA